MRLMVSLCLLAPLVLAQDVAGRADAFVSSWVRDGFFRGSVLIAKDGEAVFRKGYGMANSEWNIPNTPETKFRLGSITKQFTAACIMLLVEQGKVKLEDPIAKYYPEAPPTWEKVTIHHLLNHTSGIPSYTSLPDFFRKSSRSPLTPVEIVKLTQEMPLEFAPGEKFRYNNTGYILLGVVLEKVANEPYAAHVRKAIFEPLGMKDSGYDSSETVIPRRASGYAADGRNAPYLDMSLPYAAGSLYSTVDDLLIWDRAFFGGKVVKAESLTKMTTPGLEKYGYGLHVESAHDRRVIGHGGGINGFNTSLLRLPDQNIVVAVLANQNSSAPDRMARDLARLAAGDDVPPRPLRTEVVLPSEKLDAVVGEYELRPGAVMKVFRDGDRLMSQMTNQNAVQIFPMSEKRFFPKVVDAELEFEFGTGGPATTLVLTQNGRTMRAARK